MIRNLFKKLAFAVLSVACVATFSIAAVNVSVAKAEGPIITKVNGVVTGVDTKLRFTCEDTSVYGIGFSSYTSAQAGDFYTGSITLNGIELNVLSNTYTKIGNYQVGGSTSSNNIFIGFKDVDGADLAKDEISSWIKEGYKKPTIKIAKDTVIKNGANSVQISEDATFHFNNGFWQYGEFVIKPNTIGLTGKFGTDMDCNLRFCATNLPNNFGNGHVATFNNDSITVEYTGTITLNGKDIKEYVKKGKEDTTSYVDYISIGYSADLGWLPEHFCIKFMSLTDLTKDDGMNVNVKTIARDETVYKYPTIFIAKDTIITNTSNDVAVKFDKDYYIYYLSGKNTNSPYWVFGLDQTVPEVTIQMNVLEGTKVSEIESRISATDDMSQSLTKNIEWAENVEEATELAAGNYNITVTTKDETGNVSVVKVVLTVDEVKNDVTTESKKENGKNGCNSSVDTMGIMFISMMMVAGVCLLKKKKNI